MSRASHELRQAGAGELVRHSVLSANLGSRAAEGQGITTVVWAPPLPASGRVLLIPGEAVIPKKDKAQDLTIRTYGASPASRTFA